jgi:hypothetical protein
MISFLYHLFNIRDCPEEGVYLLRDYRVSEASQAVHPGGNPISHSTHSGFREPEAPERISSPGRESRFPAPGGRVAFFASFAVGVGNIRATPARVSRGFVWSPRSRVYPCPLQSVAVIVGKIWFAAA